MPRPKSQPPPGTSPPESDTEEGYVTVEGTRDSFTVRQRAPGEHPAEGETIQEHDLAHRRDHLAEDQGQQPASKKETWKDWAGPDASEPRRLLTREELIAELHALGTDVAINDLRYWEYEGVLPRPVRRQRWATYPLWVIPLVVTLRELQAGGLALRDIATILREKAPAFAEAAATWERKEAEIPGFLDRSLIFQPATEVVANALVNDALTALAHRVGRMLGQPVRQVRLELRRQDATPIHGASYTLTIPPDTAS